MIVKRRLTSVFERLGKGDYEYALKHWLEQLEARPAVRRGMAVPEPVRRKPAEEELIEQGRKILV
jgi:hypothetical protein